MTAARHLRFWKRALQHALLLAAANSNMAVGQAKPPAHDPTTIHVYVNLVQVPVLVLDGYRRTKPPIPSSRFLVKVDKLPIFHPQHVRLEGDDPIALTLLVDTSVPHGPLWNRLPQSLDPLLKKLGTEDTIDVYAMDGCALRHFGSESAPDAEHLQSQIASAVAIKPYEQVRRQAGPCQNIFSLWNAMGYITLHPGKHNGRRVLLMITDGKPPADAQSMRDLGVLMDSQGVAAFAVAEENTLTGFTRQVYEGHAEVRADPWILARPLSETDALDLQCERSGGMLVPATAHGLPKTLAHVIDLVRDRYIVEFPRPDVLGAGQFGIEVSIGDPFAFVRTGGAVARVASAEEARDPNVEHGALAPDGDGDDDPAGVHPAHPAPVK